MHTLYLIVDLEDFENIAMSWEGSAKEALRAANEMFGDYTPELINDHSTIARIEVEEVTPELIWAFVNLVRTGNSASFEAADSSFETLNYNKLLELVLQEEHNTKD